MYLQFQNFSSKTQHHLQHHPTSAPLYHAPSDSPPLYKAPSNSPPLYKPPSDSPPLYKDPMSEPKLKYTYKTLTKSEYKSNNGDTASNSVIDNIHGMEEEDLPSTEPPFIPSVYPTKEYKPPVAITTTTIATKDLRPSTPPEVHTLPSTTRSPYTPPSTPAHHNINHKLPSRNQKPPSKGYLPPHEEMQRPVKTYLPPVKGHNYPSLIEEPKDGYLPPRTNQPPNKAYLPPSPAPIESYLTPSDNYLPPSDNYLPPSDNYNHYISNEPVIANTYTDNDSSPPVISSLPPNPHPSKTYHSYHPSDSIPPALAPIDVFHAQVKNSITSLHDKHNAKSHHHQVIDLTTNTADEDIVNEHNEYIADVHLLQFPQQDHLSNYHVASNSHHGSQSHQPQHYQTSGHQPPQAYIKQPHLPEYADQLQAKYIPHQPAHYTSTEKLVDFSNREALQEALKTLKPENRVITVTEPPQLGQLRKTTPISTSTSSSTTSTTTTSAPTSSSSSVLLTTEMSKMNGEAEASVNEFALGANNAREKFVFGPKRNKQDMESAVQNQFTDEILRYLMIRSKSSVDIYI